MKVDTVAMSVVWGRVGASVLMVVAVAASFFGIEVDADTQQATIKLVAEGIGLLGAAMALISKVREIVRIKNG